MKTKNFKLLSLIIAVAAFTFSLVSCGDDNNDDPTSVDKTELEAAIEKADSLITNTEEGAAEGQYLSGSKDVLQTTIDAAQAIYDSELSTQTAVDNAVTAVNAAITVYEGNIVSAIAADALVGQWTFDDGSGTTLKDYSGNSYDGTLLDGSATWGGDKPEWTTDRYGNEGSALSFDKGAHVSIPYNIALNPSSMSISLWLNSADTLESNRFIGLNSWRGYKFQLQSANKPYFTICTAEAEDGGVTCIETDAGRGISNNVWHHLVVTYTSGTMAFYIDGGLAKSATTNEGDIRTITTNNALVFGCGADVYDDDETDADGVIPLAWGGYFHGKLDEIRIYNTALTAAQVSSIYALEKVTEE